VNRAAVLVLAGALLAAPWAGHIDDTDAQLYQVLARNMAATHRWLEPGLPPSSARPFREHLPFGLWPYAAAVRAAGERALPWIAAAFSLLTVAALLVAAPGASGAAAALVLATTETFFLYGGRSRLDPPLVFFTTLSFLLVQGSRPRWAAAGAMAALAALIKGPFGLLPLASMAAARAICERSWSTLARGAAATLAAALPAALFVFLAEPSWREGYLHGQLLASASGARTEGTTAWWGALAGVAGRFWPGLPFALLAATQRRNRMLAIACGLLLLGLSLPARKVWNHQLVAYPVLALLAGAWLAPFLERWPRVVPALAGIAAIVSALGLGARLLRPPCVASQEFAALLPPPGTQVLVVSAPTDWRTLVGLAAEQRLAPVKASALDDAPAPSVRFALVAEPLFHPGSFREVGRARGWVFAVR